MSLAKEVFSSETSDSDSFLPDINLSSASTDDIVRTMAGLTINSITAAIEKVLDRDALKLP